MSGKSLTSYVREKVFRPYSLKYKKYRRDLFNKYLTPDERDRILDHGGSDGSWLSFLVSFRNNELYVADIFPDILDTAKNKYGFKTILLDESGKIPFEDGYFDIVFCNSVIEHVTVDKKDIYNMESGDEFRKKSLERQKLLADEIRRVSKKYFVQTPYKHFIIDSHTWFPSFYLYLPRKWQIKTIRLLNKYWVKKSSPDVNLLDVKDMQNFFPDAEIIREKSLGLTKSMIAVRV